MGRWWNEPGMVEKLKLTDDQRKAMDQILLQHRETLIDLRGNVEKAELAMEPLMKADQPDESGILAQIDKVAQSRAELEKANARFLLAIRGKLTADQWKQLQAIRANRQERGGWGPEGAGRHGQKPQGDFHRQAPPAPGPQGSLEQGPGPEGPQSSAAGDVQ
jgi:Spy/CpxP family protein refolding chaperone